MSAIVVFILFIICLVIAIPVSISLGIVSVLPGAFDASFTASGQFVIRSMLGGIDSFPPPGSADVCAVRHCDGQGRHFQEII